MVHLIAFEVLAFLCLIEAYQYHFAVGVLTFIAYLSMLCYDPHVCTSAPATHLCCDRS